MVRFQFYLIFYQLLRNDRLANLTTQDGGRVTYVVKAAREQLLRNYFVYVKRIYSSGQMVGHVIYCT